MASPSAAERASAGAGHLAGTWKRLAADQKLAAVASLALFVTMFLPWYQLTVGVGSQLRSTDKSAFGVFSFVEAAILVVAVGVLGLLYARGQRRGFHLPGGDGTVLLAAGAWTVLLLVWRAFDKPGIKGTGLVGIQWGFIFAFGAAGVLAYAGWRVRSAHRPEPPNPAAATVPVEPAPGPPTAPTTPGRRAGRLRRAEPETEADDQLTIPLEEERRAEGDDHTRPHGSEPPLPRDHLTFELGDDAHRRTPGSTGD